MEPGTTPAERCVDVFLGQLKEGLSYQALLTTLFLAAIEEGLHVLGIQANGLIEVGDGPRYVARLGMGASPKAIADRDIRPQPNGL